jgi:GT2 family glycosyltransferase
MKIVVLSALGNTVAQQCIASLFETTTSVDFDLFLVRERGSREQTLNFAMSLVGIDEDVLLVGDDIKLTPGWYEALMDNYDRADILGMSMLYPGTTKVQDRGYDLVQIDDRITLEAKDRGLPKDKITAFGSRSCDALCGCFMLVKKNVFNFVSGFSEEGQNRWGEFIFTQQAQKLGFNVIVLGHYLYHLGRSTKVNPNKSLSSESYLLEQRIWRNIVNKYVDKDQVKISIKKLLSRELENILLSNKRILFYGAGTILEFICKKLYDKSDLKFIDFCSGLPEEQGKVFLNKKISFYKNVQFKRYDIVVITVLGKEREVSNLIRKYIGGKKVYYVTQKTVGNIRRFNIKCALPNNKTKV